MGLDEPAPGGGNDGDEASAARSRTAEAVIERFGGIRPMANKLGVPVTTVQGWKKRGAIPSSRRADILAAADVQGIGLSPDELDRASSPAQEDADPVVDPAPMERAAPVIAPVAPPQPSAPNPAAMPPRAERRGGGGVAAAALLVAMVALGVAMVELVSPGALPSLRGAAPPPADPRIATLAAENASLRADLAGLRDAVAALAARPAPSAADGQAASVDLAPLTATLDTLRAEVADLRAGADPARAARIEETLATLTARIDAMARDQAQRGGPVAGQAVALAMAAGRLRTAVSDGAPFARDLEAVTALAAGAAPFAAEIDALSTRAATGVATIPVLRERFRDLAASLIQADRVRPDAGLLDQTLARLASVVTIRRTDGEVAGDGADAVVARAEAALDRGDVARAAAEVERLSGQPAALAAPWLKEARARLAAEEAARTLADRAAERLTAAP